EFRENARYASTCPSIDRGKVASIVVRRLPLGPTESHSTRAEEMLYDGTSRSSVVKVSVVTVLVTVPLECVGTTGKNLRTCRSQVRRSDHERGRRLADWAGAVSVGSLEPSRASRSSCCAG